jgi:hypothetical protein
MLARQYVLVPETSEVQPAGRGMEKVTNAVVGVLGGVLK